MLAPPWGSTRHAYLQAAADGHGSPSSLVMPRPAKAGAGRRVRPGRHPRPALAARALGARIAWLSGHPVWRDDRVAWRVDDQEILPDTALLTRTERTLNRLRNQLAGSAHGAEWLVRQEALWREAKALAVLREPDLHALCTAARRGEAGAIRRLIAMIPLDAAGAGPDAVGSLAATAAGRRELSALLTSQATEAAQAAAALALAAADQRVGTCTPMPRATAWVRRSWEWGFAHGMPADRPFVLSLLQHVDRAGLAEEVVSAFERLRFLRPQSADLAVWLRSGTQAEEVLHYLEALRGVDRHVYRFHRGWDLPYDARPWEREVHALEHALLPDRAAALGRMLLTYLPPRAGFGPAAAALDLLLGYLQELAGTRLGAAEAALALLHQGLELPRQSRQEYVELLARIRNTIWPHGELPPANRRRTYTARANWLNQAVFFHPRALLRLLAETQDPEAVRLAVDRNVQLYCAAYGWRPDGLLRLLVTAPASLAAAGIHRLKVHLEALPPVERLPALREIQRVLEALPAERLAHLASSLWTSLDLTREAMRRDLSPALRTLPLIWAADPHSDADECFCDELVESGIRLFRDHPRQAEGWVAWLAGRAAARRAGGGVEWRDYSRFTRSAAVASALSQGSSRRFQAVFNAHLAVAAEAPEEPFDRGLGAVKRHPHLVTLLARISLTQAARVEKLVTSAGLALRLRPDVLDCLDDLEPTVEDAGQLVPEGWAAVIDLGPDALRLAAGYVRAEVIAGAGGPPPVPRGVAEALSLPDKLRRELAHLERRNAAGGRPALLARAANLRARLADGDRLARQVALEATDRLQQAWADAQFSAAWHLINQIFHQRLETLVGPIPADLEMSRDLLNAALLGIDIRSNRPLLRRLLRAHFRGAPDWRERHPANAAFLDGLRRRGVDVDLWLASCERRYRCPGAPGGWVRVHLETDPIRVLQMGNYFDTCLSFGQCNAFSTVANAAELNKRVLYVTDAEGRVVGRKLIGIDEHGELVGFRTYTSLPNAAQNEAVRATVFRYLRRFAHRCRLTMGERGPVEKLFAQAWYDDGIVPWKEDPAATSSGRSQGEVKRAGEGPERGTGTNHQPAVRTG